MSKIQDTFRNKRTVVVLVCGVCRDWSLHIFWFLISFSQSMYLSGQTHYHCLAERMLLQELWFKRKEEEKKNNLDSFVSIYIIYIFFTLTFNSMQCPAKMSTSGIKTPTTLIYFHKNSD